MSELPFLVVYGGVVWKILVGVSLMAGPVWFARGRPWLARRRAQRTLRNLGSPTTLTNDLAEGALQTVEGTLHASGDVCARMEDGRPAAISSAEARGKRYERATLRAETLELDVGDHRVELVGDVRILVGSRLFTSIARLDEAGRKRIHDASPRHGFRSPGEGRPLLWSVDDKVRVRVRGKLERSAAVGSASGGYRTNSVRWRMSPNGAMPIDVAAVGSVDVVVPWRNHVVRTALMSCAMGLALAYGVGSFSMLLSNRDSARVMDEGRFEMGQLNPLSIASATPFHRDDALDDLKQQTYGPHSESGYRAAIAIAELRHDAEVGLRLTLESRSFAEARRYSKTHTYVSRDFASQLAARAEFASANEAWKSALGESQRFSVVPVVAPAIAAKDWKHAARLFEQIANVHHDLAHRAHLARCLAEAARAHDDPTAVARLRALADGPARSACILLLADSSPRAERIAILNSRAAEGGASPGPWNNPRIIDEIALLLRVEATGEARSAKSASDTDMGRSLQALIELSETMDRFAAPPLLALQVSALEELSKSAEVSSSPLRFRLARSLAAFSLVRGALQASQQYVDLAGAALATLSADDARSASVDKQLASDSIVALQALIQWWKGDPKAALATASTTALPASSGASDHAPYTGVLRAELEVVVNGDFQYCAEFWCGTSGKMPLRWYNALRGDGRELIAQMKRIRGVDQAFLQILGPHIVTGREELQRMLRKVDGRKYARSDFMLSSAWRARRRSRAASALGDDDFAEREDALARRFIDVLLRREDAVMLALVLAYW